MAKYRVVATVEFESDDDTAWSVNDQLDAFIWAMGLQRREQGTTLRYEMTRDEVTGLIEIVPGRFKC